MKNGDTQSSQKPKIGWRHLCRYSLIFIMTPIFTFIFGKLVDAAFGFSQFPPFPINLFIGFSVFFVGLAIGIKSTRVLYKVGKGLPWGELNSQSKSVKLVTTGPYTYSRNPMTLGYTMLPFGMGIMFQSPNMTLFVPAIVLLITVVWIKKKEEPNLEQRFGVKYLEYKQRTPFLFPNPKPLILDFAFSILGQGNGRNQVLGHFKMLSLAYIGISLLGLCLLVVLAFNVPFTTTILTFQKQLVGFIFSAICLFGMVAGISPANCSGILHFRKSKKNISTGIERTSLEEKTMVLNGHHPVCGNFSSHILHLDNKVYCAGCGGLITGTMMALFGSVLYFFNGFQFGKVATLYAFWLGFIGVVCGLVQYNLPVKSSIMHFLINVTFVLGAFLLLAGVNEVSSSLVLDLYLLALIIFWIMTRIMLSQLEHRRICETCGLKSCSLFFSLQKLV